MAMNVDASKYYRINYGAPSTGIVFLGSSQQHYAFFNSLCNIIPLHIIMVWRQIPLNRTAVPNRDQPNVDYKEKIEYDHHRHHELRSHEPTRILFPQRLRVRLDKIEEHHMVMGCST